ncbi:MAG: glycosyltransferase family 2 protein [Eubacterium sp.]
MSVMEFIRKFISVFNYFCMAYTLSLSVIYLIQFIISIIKVKKDKKAEISDDYRRYEDSENLLPISLIVPAYNEQENIVHNVKSLMKINYPVFEIIVINDGSSDNTHKEMIDAFNLKQIEASIKVEIQTQDIQGVYYSSDYPNLIYLDKLNGGKSDALNAGINASSYPLFACLDADSRIEKDALLKLSQLFLKDSSTVVAGGFVRIANGSVIEDGEWREFNIPKKMVERFQIVEYFRSFLYGRVSWGRSLLIVSGAFGLFRKDAVIKVGGYKTDTVGEDMEIVVRLHHQLSKEKKKRKGKKYTIAFCHEAVCWTQGPMSFKDLKNQRRRWQVGLFDTLLNHFSMTFNPRYGAVGLISIPYNWIYELFGAVIEILGYFIIPFSLIMGELNIFFFVIYLLLTVSIGSVFSIGGVILEQYTRKGCMTPKQAMTLACYALIEGFGYRQLVVLSRVQGILRFRKLKNQWGSIKRKSFNE